MPSDRPRRSLWADASDTAGEHDWLGQRQPAAEPEPDEQPPATPLRRPRWGRRAAVLLAALVIVIGGVTLGKQLTEDSVDAPVAAVLPVVNGKTATTRANQIYSAASPGVVQIRTGNASGTGFVLDQNGTIVTNAHVVDSARTVEVDFDDSDKGVNGKVLGRDVSSDLAVIRVDPGDVSKLVPLALADSDQVNTGDEVLAIGYPLGLDRTATSGIVSGLGRQIQAQNGFSIDKVIQTDASINPGNSGGPLLDARGAVIGVNSQIAATAAGSNTGIGFAIPSNTVREVVPKLIAGKSIARPYLGISMLEGTVSGTSGAQVGEVVPNGPADDAGLVGSTTSGGDVITSVDGQSVNSSDDVISALSGKSPGDKIELKVSRNGRERSVTVTLGERPTNAATSSSSGSDPTPTPTTPADPSFP